MAQFNPKEFVYHYRNGKPAYYSYDEELYCGTFPEEWVLDHFPDTGPRECENCAYYGSWNGVFLGYCANCAINAYNGERGHGFIDIGREYDTSCDMDAISVFDTYLKNVLPDEVGDKDFMDSAAAQGYQTPPEEEPTVEEKYPDIDFDEVNAHYDEMSREEEQCEVSYTIDRGGYGSNYDGGYDSY
uniref:Uncharacterized protein n=1 Tax=viral metagenome TaxID=1070528 RepID=A0A6C0K4B1_9ZZZZ